jgi:hypothetical protein
MNDWKIDKRWSDRFFPEIKRILGEHLIGEASKEDDAEKNTDLIVLKLDAVRIACRVRRHKHLEKYGNEFTLRFRRPSGVKTEFDKVIEGWGDYLFYSFCNETETILSHWILGNLNALRLHIHKTNQRGAKCWREFQNPDRSATLAAFRYAEIPDFIISTGCLDKTIPEDSGILF